MDAAYGDDRADQSRVLTKVLWAEAESVRFSDEDMARLLEPLRRRIMAGEFSRPRRGGRPVRLTAKVAAVALLAAAFVQAWAGNAFVVVEDNPVPLSDSVAAGNTLSGRVVLEGSGVGGVRLALVSAGSEEGIQTVTTGPDGAYAFPRLSAGIYRLRVTLPPGLALLDPSDIETDVEISDSDNDEWEGLTIRLCRS